MFEVSNGNVQIDGKKGIYDNKNITNPSEKYGRNAINNYYSYLEAPMSDNAFSPAPILDFGLNPNAADENAAKLEKFTKENDEYLKSLPPLEFEYRYMPNIHKRGEIDKEALFGAAYEEMGGRTEVRVKDVDKTFGITSDYSSEALDINKDGNIDIGEYSASILAADMLSKSENPEPSMIDGTINQKGLSKVYEYTKKSNAQAAANLYANLYNQFQLGNDSKNFKPNA